MIDDTHLLYDNRGTPLALTFDGEHHTIEEWRAIITRSKLLIWRLSLALLYGAVIGIATALVFLK